MKETLGTWIAELRKQQGLTQAQLAEQLGVTDKAVSKWERNVSCPDISSLPRLAELLGVSVDQLMQGGGGAPAPRSGSLRETADLVLTAVSLAMGVAVVVLSLLGRLDRDAGMIMLGIGLAALSLRLLEQGK